MTGYPGQNEILSTLSILFEFPQSFEDRANNSNRMNRMDRITKPKTKNRTKN
jgi:hypothetical protein